MQQEIECAFGDIDLLGLSEAELDQQCDDIFQDIPLVFGLSSCKQFLSIWNWCSWPIKNS